MDSAVATSFCLGLFSMHSTGIGGGGLMLVYKRATKTMESFDYREVAPGKSREDMFVDDATKSKTGILCQFDINFAFFLLVLVLAVLVSQIYLLFAYEVDRYAKSCEQVCQYFLL